MLRPFLSLLFLAFLSSPLHWDEPGSPASWEEDCRWGEIVLHGKVTFVESFPDLKIQYVESFPDLRVKFVGAFPDDCGEWQVVDAFPDFRVQVVDAFPDIKVKIVEAFPGMN